LRTLVGVPGDKGDVDPDSDIGDPGDIMDTGGLDKEDTVVVGAKRSFLTVGCEGLMRKNGVQA
jgi:hypothetical protein